MFEFKYVWILNSKFSTLFYLKWVSKYLRLFAENNFMSDNNISFEKSSFIEWQRWFSRKTRFSPFSNKKVVSWLYRYWRPISQCRHRSDDWLSPIQHRSLQLNTWEESFWLILKFQFLTKIHQITSLLASMISISRQEYWKPNLSNTKIMLDKLLLAIRY